MKPYITAYKVAMWQRYHKNKPINIDAVTDFFKGGLEKELERLHYDEQRIDVLEDIKEWYCELYTWIYSAKYWIHNMDYPC